jgi:UPF0755 protein
MLLKNPNLKGVNLFWVAAVLLIIAASLATWIWIYAKSPGPLANNEQIVYLPPHSSFKKINQILIDSKVVNADRRFAILARLLGSASHIQAGEYRFATGISPYNLLKELQSGKTVNRFFTIAEGLNLMQAANIMAKAGLGNAGEIIALSRDPAFINELGLRTKSLEGFLFPDTYFFKRGMPVRKMLKIMVKRTEQVFNNECRQQSPDVAINCDLFAEPPKQQPRKSPLRLSAQQALILASIVEKETGNAAERPIIAQVFISRLRKKMRLQSDPTVIYGLQKFNRPLSHRDLKTPSPYNTYTLAGLPAGPICNPGQAAIAAVMRPAQTDYYYFVSKNNGSHKFSKTLREHNQAVKKFRQSRSAKSE